MRLKIKYSRVFDIVNLMINISIDYCFIFYKKIHKNNYDDSVLIILLGGIGDYVLFTASLQGYRDLYKNKKIVFLGRNELSSLIEHCPLVDYFIPINYRLFKKSIMERIRVARELAKHNYSLCINASYSSTHDKIERPLIIWSKAKRRIAFQCLDKIDIRDYSIYTEVLKQSKEWEFEIDRNNRLVQYLGGEKYNNNITRIWGITKENTINTLKRKGVMGKYFVIFPGAYSAIKCWPIDNFKKLLSKFATMELSAIICGSQKESNIAKEMLNIKYPKIYDFTGKTSTFELAQIISQAQFLISNDSVAVHIAGALDISCIALLGGGHYGRFLPYPYKSSIVTISSKRYQECFRCYWNCIYDSANCIEDITVESVDAEIIKMVRSGKISLL